MATGTLLNYGNFYVAALNKEIDWNSDDIRIMHVSSAYTPDQDAHAYYSSVVANEVTGTNVPANGTALTTCTVTYTGATNTIKLDADDYSVSTATATGIATSIIYDRTPATDATRPLIGYIPWSVAMSPSAGTLSVVFDSAGVTKLVVS
jgi:hypothetical protein